MPYSQSFRDFDAWASAVRQQMLESLARRRNIVQQSIENVTTARQVRESDS